MANLFFAIGEIAFLTACFYKNILTLRISMVIGQIFSIIAILVAGLGAPGMAVLFFFSMASFLINSVRILQIINENNLLLIPMYYRPIYQKNFSMMTASQFLKLQKMATFEKLPIDTVLTKDGEQVQYLMLIIKGVAKVTINNKVQAILGSHLYIGEMSFLSGDNATGTVVTIEDLELMRWNKITLSKLEQDDPSLYHLLTLSISNNLIAKIKHQNVPGPN